MEVMISLVLLTIVLGAVYSSFFSVQRALDRYEGVSMKYHEARTALDIMRREIESALIDNSVSAEKEEARTRFVIKDRDFMGKKTSELQLTAFSIRGDILQSIGYTVREENKTLILTKQVAPSMSPVQEYTMDIMEDIGGFSVETRFNNKWVGTWDAAKTGKLPGPVRISISFNEKGKVIDLKEYARPRVGSAL